MIVGSTPAGRAIFHGKVPEWLNGQVSKTLEAERPTRVQISPFPLMTITICGSMQFHHEMSQTQYLLEEVGHSVLVPKDLTILEQNESYMETDEERVTSKIEHDFIREHFKKIERSDAILVRNYEKKGVAGYIGGNTFLEMGHAFGLGKKIYLLYPVPDMDYSVEMQAMQPIILNGDFSKLG